MNKLLKIFTIFFVLLIAQNSMGMLLPISGRQKARLKKRAKEKRKLEMAQAFVEDCQHLYSFEIMKKIENGFIIGKDLGAQLKDSKRVIKENDLCGCCYENFINHDLNQARSHIKHAQDDDEKIATARATIKELPVRISGMITFFTEKWNEHIRDEISRKNGSDLLKMLYR